MPRRLSNRGFTLLELIVALTLSTVVVLLAHGILSGVADASRALCEARVILDRNMNARRWLSEAFGSLEVGTQAGGFVGRRARVEFVTGQIVPDGWLEARRVSLEQSGDSLVATPDAGPPLVLARQVASLEFDYLLDPGANTTWVREWISPVSAPLAVRLRIGYRERVDTLLMLVGPRG